MGIVIFYFAIDSYALKSDTIRINYNQMMICADTIYFGVSDSVVVLPMDKKYKIQRNFLLRSNAFYEKRPKKKQQIEDRVKHYYDLWQDIYINDTNQKDIANAQHYFEQFEGKVIRNIKFQEIEMFEGEVTDTAKISITSIGKQLNKMHVSTRTQVIKNNLRFNEHERVSAWQLAENERLLRQLKYIEDARIEISQENLLSDSVDITIITKDIFPYGISFNATGTDEFSVAPNMSNFLGLGHYIEVGVHHKLNEKPTLGYSYQYLATNLYGSFIDAGINRISNYKKDNLSLLIERPFVTTDMRIGGSLLYEDKRESLVYSYDDIDSTFLSPYHSRITDGWMGKTFILSPSGQKPNISIASRYYQEEFLERPYVSADSNLVFHDKNISLSTLMVQKVSFFKTKKIYGFGITEDIPIGYSFKATSGYSWNDYYKRPYFGGDFAIQMVRPKKGLLRFNIELASFYYSGVSEDAFIKLNTAYISPLKKLKVSELRHFVYVKINTLHNKRYYNLIEFENDIIDTNDNNLKGNSSFSIQYKPTFFIPYTVAGFKFTLTPFTDIGLMGKNDFLEGSKTFISAHGLTIRVKNESLVIPTFGIDLKYYPKYGSDRNSFAFRAYFRDTELIQDLFSPKPKLIEVR